MKLERNIYPHDTLLIKSGLYVASISLLLIIVGLNYVLLWILLLGSLIMLLCMVVRRKLLSFYVTEDGIGSRRPFSRKFISWSNITKIEYQNLNTLGYSSMGNPKLIFISVSQHQSIDVFIDDFDRREILDLLKEVLSRKDDVILHDRIQKTLPYGFLPSDRFV